MAQPIRTFRLTAVAVTGRCTTQVEEGIRCCGICALRALLRAGLRLSS